MLVENQITPGLYTNQTFNSLLDSFITLPIITHQDVTQGTNYVNIEYGTTMWNALVKFCYKAFTLHPYILGTNQVAVFSRPNIYSRTIAKLHTLELGYENNYSQMFSNLHMQDIYDTSNTYTLENEYATERSIVRHKHFELDRTFLNDPIVALNYRRDLSMRRNKADYCEFDGFLNLELGDLFSITGTTIKYSEVSRIIYSGDKHGVTTKVYGYYDKFRNLIDYSYLG
jgi:hypothetical protein